MEFSLCFSFRTTKRLLIIFNSVYMLLGLAVQFMGGLALEENPTTVADPLKALILFDMLLAGCVFVVAFVGYYGATRESRCMLYTFAGLLMIVLFCKTVVVALVFMGNDRIEPRLIDELFIAARNGDKDSATMVDAFQKRAKCCGTSGASFWGSKIPASCCPEWMFMCTASSSYITTCREAFSAGVMAHLQTVGTIAAFNSFVEALGVCFSLKMADGIKRLATC